MKSLKFLITFFIVLTWLLCNTVFATQDTTLVSSNTNKYNVGRCITFDIELDSISTNIMITDRFDITDFYGKTICFSWYYIDTAFGLSANSDTTLGILMGVDDFGHAAAADTVGAGNAAAEILVSTGTLQMAELTLYKTFPKYFFRFTPKVTGGHKNSYGRIQGCLWYKNT